MTVKELIEKLKILPQDARVGCVWDGEMRSEADLVWLARSGYVVIIDYGSYVYSNRDRPIWAPTEKENRYWTATHQKEQGE